MKISYQNAAKLEQIKKQFFKIIKIVQIFENKNLCENYLFKITANAIRKFKKRWQ